MSAERELAERIIRAWEAQPYDDDSGFGEKVILARAFLALSEPSETKATMPKIDGHEWAGRTITFKTAEEAGAVMDALQSAWSPSSAIQARSFAEVILGEVQMRGEVSDDLILRSIKTLCEKELGE